MEATVCWIKIEWSKDSGEGRTNHGGRDGEEASGGWEKEGGKEQGALMAERRNLSAETGQRGGKGRELNNLMFIGTLHGFTPFDNNVSPRRAKDNITY